MVRTWSKLGITSQLYLLGAVVFLPIAVLIGLNICGDYRQEIAEESSTAFRHARNVAAQTAHFNQQSFETLQELARRPAIRAMSTTPCDTVFDHFLAANKSYANLLLDNADGDVICNAANGPNLKGLVTHRPWFKRLMATGKREVGDPTVGRVVGRWIAALAEPVVDDAGKVRGALVFTVDLWNYQLHLDRDFKDSLFLVTVLDSQGAVVARSREPDRWVGKKVQLPFEAIRAVKAGDTGLVSDVDGLEQLYGHAPVPGTDWVVLVSSPKSVVSAEVWERIKFELTLGGSMIALLFIAAFLVAKRIQAPIKAISHAAEAVGDGRFDVRLPEAGGNRELSILAQKFNRMVEQRNAAETRQAQATVDLAASEENLRLIADNVPAIITYLDTNLRYRFINQRFTETFGLRTQDVYGKHLREVLGENVYRAVEANVAKALSGNPVTIERSQTLPSGEVRYFESRLIPHLSENQSIDGLYALTLDITERNRALAQLRLAANVFDNAAEGILITDKDDNIVSANRSFTEITGYSAQEAIGKNPSLLSSGRQAPAFYDEMWASINATGRWWGEVWDRRKSGESYCESLSICAIRDERGAIANYCAIFADITDRKIAETELVELNAELEARVAQRANAVARSQHLLKAIVDHSSAMIALRDLDWRYILVNKAWAAAIGKTPAEVEGKTVRELFQPPVCDKLEADNRLVAKNRSAHEFEDVIPEVTGERTRLTVKFPLFEPDGSMYAIGSVSTDITSRKQWEIQIGRLNDELQQKAAELAGVNQELETFSYSVSHDLRAPLRSIAGFGKILLKENYEQLDAAGRDHLQRIIAASARMGQLIDDLLKLSRIMRQPLAIELVDLSAVAREVIDTLAKEHPERRVEVGIEPDLAVRADPSLMRVVVDNLIGNAWKFSGKSAQARIDVGSTIRDGATVFYVRDNGAGFEMTYADRLFHAFQRLHGADQFEGTGIGLATVERIIRRHGGRIWAEGKVNEGATFYFTLEVCLT